MPSTRSRFLAGLARQGRTVVTILRTDQYTGLESFRYELDHRKDQVMSVYKVALANLGMWVRDGYFPASYAYASWHRLRPFFSRMG